MTLEEVDMLRNTSGALERVRTATRQDLVSKKAMI